HAPVGGVGAVRGRRVWDRGGPGTEGEARGAEVAGEPGTVPERPRPQDPVRVHAQAQLVAEPDRDLVQRPGQEIAEAVQLLLAGSPEAEDPALHRLLQPHDGQAHRLDVFAQAALRAERDRIAIPGFVY